MLHAYISLMRLFKILVTKKVSFLFVFGFFQDRFLCVALTFHL